MFEHIKTGHSLAKTSDKIHDARLGSLLCLSINTPVRRIVFRSLVFALCGIMVFLSCFLVYFTSSQHARMSMLAPKLLGQRINRMVQSTSKSNALSLPDVKRPEMWASLKDQDVWCILDKHPLGPFAKACLLHEACYDGNALRVRDETATRALSNVSIISGGGHGLHPKLFKPVHPSVVIANTTGFPYYNAHSWPAVVFQALFWHNNFGHYIIDNVLPAYFAAAAFGLQETFTLKLQRPLENVMPSMRYIHTRIFGTEMEDSKWCGETTIVGTPAFTVQATKFILPSALNEFAAFLRRKLFPNGNLTLGKNRKVGLFPKHPSQRRHIENYADVLNECHALGLDIDVYFYEDMSAAQSVDIMDTFAVYVSPTGSISFNAFFLRPEATFVYVRGPDAIEQAYHSAMTRPRSVEFAVPEEGWVLRNETDFELRHANLRPDPKLLCSVIARHMEKK